MSDHRYQHLLSEVALEFADAESANSSERLKSSPAGLTLTVKKPTSNPEQD